MFIQTESTPNPATLKFLPGPDRARNGHSRFPECRRGHGLAAGQPHLFGRQCHRCVLRLGLCHRDERRGNGLGSCETDDPWCDHGTFPIRRPSDGRRKHRPCRACRPRRSRQRDRETDQRTAGYPACGPPWRRMAATSPSTDLTAGVVYLHMQGACAGCPSSTPDTENGHRKPAAHITFRKCSKSARPSPPEAAA